MATAIRHTVPAARSANSPVGKPEHAPVQGIEHTKQSRIGVECA